MSVHAGPSDIHPEHRGGGLAVSGRKPLTLIRITGLLAAVGPTIWALTQFVAGERVLDKQLLTYEVAGFLSYQVGVIPLVVTVLAVGATGSGKGRAFPLVELGVLALALVWTLGSFHYTNHDVGPLWMKVTDLCWPLSQVGLLVNAVAIAKVGRWRGSLRWHLLPCSLWQLVANLATPLPGSWGVYVSAIWLIATFGTLGARLALRPQEALPATN